MAAPTSTEDNLGRGYTLNITGTNVDAGNNEYTLNYFAHGLYNGFSIITGTLTAMDVTVRAYNIASANARDVTSDLFGVSTLASNTQYVCDLKYPVQHLVIRAARSNATNAVNFEVFCPKRS